MRTERTELRRLLEHLYARGFRVSGIDDGPGRREVWGGSDATKHGGLRGLYGYVTRNRDKFEEANIDTKNYLQAILRFAETDDSENYVGSIAGLTGTR